MTAFDAAIRELRARVQALYLEVEPSIARDVMEAVDAVASAGTAALADAPAARQGEAQPDEDMARLRRDVERLTRENEWFRAAHMLIANSDAFVAAPDRSPFWYVTGDVASDGTPLLSLNMNDTFHYACADSEPFRYEDAPDLLRIAKEEGWPGINRWAMAKRGAPVIEPVQKRAAAYDDALSAAKAEIERLRAESGHGGER